MNVLLIYLQPKDIPEVLDELKKIPVDQVHLKYFPYPEVYKIAMNIIKKYPRYDFIFWLQNDIVLNKEYFFQMCEDIKTNNFDILGCSMNVDLTSKGFEKCAYTMEKYHNEKDPPYVDLGDHTGIISVFHNGGPFICKREILINQPLRGSDKGGYNADYYHGLDLDKAGIPYFLDADIQLKHLRYVGVMQVGKKQKETKFYEN